MMSLEHKQDQMNNESNNVGNLIAPCGMNCGICMAYLRNKNTCPGCRNLTDQSKSTCLKCKIRACKVNYCFECKEYPCKNLKHLDKRYRTKYGMSMIENLNKIKEVGLSEFMKIENRRWVCKQCGHQICVHNKKCYFCEKNQRLMV